MNARTAALLLLLAVAAAPGIAGAPAPKPEKRWLYLPTNLYVAENVTKAETLLRRAKAAGYNGVLFADYKTGFWWKLDDAPRWKANAGRIRALTRELGMTLAVAVLPFGYSGSMLTHDPNLAEGMPVVDCPLVVRGGTLVPEPTATLANGSFEEHSGDVARGFGFQDDPGRGSFIDAAIVKDGRASLRFEDVGKANPYGHGRINQQLAVRPWQQYRIRAWLRAEHLTADEIRITVLAGNRTLQYQHLSVGAGARDLTRDWTEESVCFNSLGNEKVLLYLGMWGGKTGKLWIDDVRIEPAPAMNLLRRDGLPLSIRPPDGKPLVEGKDYEALADPGLGTKPYAGNYDTRHDPPEIRLAKGSRAKEGDRLLLSAWHTSIVYDGQVAISLGDPRVFALAAEEVRRVREALDPDAYFLSHDEIRVGGYEPSETGKYRTSGELLAANLKRSVEIARKEGGGRPVHVWSDMFDPNHNARADYYLVNNTLEGSWEGLDGRVGVMKWGGGKIARPGLEFFAARGNPQMIAAFYDGDPAADHDMWTAAAAGIPRVDGVMYTTWRNDYSQLERFADLWWGDGK